MTHRVHIDTLDGKATLEGDFFSSPSTLGIILTHPMPLLGGNMYNNVVSSVFKALCRLGYSVLRFNFRGVGNSTGSGSWRGSHERNDVLSCCDYLLAKEIKKIVLVGYSYGAVIASSCAKERDQIVGFACISYPFGPLNWMLLGHLLKDMDIPKPKFFVMGDQDDFTGEATFLLAYHDLPETKAKILVSGANHFWVEHIDDLVLSIVEWVRKIAED
eukprot:TRINITY_DN12918_c0_g1_i1.p1 TRINITY_DN12918_c0_g1~~TRINITY_DN12918_c0_g1_i1.p1  ORF type:complete len:238 (+),score=38.36 TRINITY_DN12918_c0_g1_i1:69-716(+)